MAVTAFAVAPLERPSCRRSREVVGPQTEEEDADDESVSTTRRNCKGSFGTPSFHVYHT